MILGKVIARVVTNLKHPAYKDRKLLLVRPVNLAGEEKPGSAIVAVDAVCAGPNDIVLVNQEGRSARAIVAVKDAPVRSVIIAIVDHWEENGILHRVK